MEDFGFEMTVLRQKTLMAALQAAVDDIPADVRGSYEIRLELLHKSSGNLRAFTMKENDNG